MSNHDTFASDMIKIMSVAFTILVVTVGGCMAIKPRYNVYAKEMAGRAELAKAVNERKVQVEQARGEQEAAVMRAAAIQTVGKAAKEYPEYRQQEFIGAFGEALKNGDIDQIIYVATESGIPVTEATRLKKSGE